MGWSNTKQLLIIDDKKVARGDFGEVLISEILQEFHDYLIPIKKLRYRTNPNLPSTGTDLIAFKLNEEQEIAQMCYVESKLISGSKINKKVAINAYEQLRKDYESQLPNILHFIGSRLAEKQHELYAAFMNYLKSRKDIKDKDTFRIGLCWDKNNWDEIILDNLQNEDITIPALTVEVIYITDLGQLIDKLYN